MKNNIPQGYKATALGIIPQEWEVMRLEDLCHNEGDYGINAPATDFSDKLPTYLRITDIDDDGKFIIANKASVNNPNSGSYHLKDGDIVFARTGATVGKTYLYNREDGDLVFAGFLIRFSPNAQKIVPYYLKAYTNTSTYWKWVKITSQRSGQPGINATEYCSLQIPVPPLAEQRKIAEVLGVWDEAIEKQARLIEKLALRKRALMQRLLSAKLRLPGFSEPCKKIKLGDIGHFLSSNTLSRDCLNEQIGNIKNIHYGDILIKLPTIVDASFIHIPYVNDDVIVKSDYLKNGDIIFADTAEDYTVGKAIEIINIQAIPVTSGLHTIPFRPKSGIFVNRFLGYYVNSTDYRRQLQPLIQGIKVYSISKTALCKTTLKIPTLSEQTAIAEVLTAADREIELAKEKLERLRRQKRGLMQQLLTGKKRVKY